MIYLVFYLIRAALLIALPIAWLVGIYSFARMARRYVARDAALYGIAASLAIAPFAWISYGWYLFKASCSEIKPLAQFSSIDRQKSVLVRLDRFSNSIHIQIGEILERVGPVCIEREFWKPLTNPQTKETFRFERRCGRDYLRSNDLISRYAVSVKAANDINGLGYLLTYRVEDTKEAKLIAEAREALFGRGLLSQYIGLFSGSNNPEYLACGYVDSAPRVWRKTRGTLQEYESYIAMDQKLFEIAVGQDRAR